MLTLGKLIEQITTRPTAFVQHGTFDEVAAFITGFDWAVKSYTGLDRYETELGHFRTWLVGNIPQHKEIAKNLGWENYIGLETSDADRLGLLRQLFKEFESSAD